MALSISRARVSLFDLAARFFAPTRTSTSSARAEAVKDGRGLAPTEGSSLRVSSTTAHLT